MRDFSAAFRLACTVILLCIAVARTASGTDMRTVRHSPVRMPTAPSPIAMFSEYPHDVIYQLQPDGTVINISRQIREYGYEPEAIVGKRLRHIIDASYHERAIAFFAASLQGQEGSGTLQFELVAPDGIIGKTDYELPWHETADNCLRADREIIDSSPAIRGIVEPVITADGACQFLLKPVNQNVLAKAMCEALRSRPATPTRPR